MWLIEASTLRLKEFISLEVAPPYTILSHTWGSDEVQFLDMNDLSLARQKAGFQKIEYICAQTIKDGLNYAWVDTCCIDKRSSAELSEAINSMYSWYNGAVRCYVYLVDVSGDYLDLKDDVDPKDELKGITCLSPPTAEHLFENQLNQLLAFRRSRWFSRGWTLQELLAPRAVEFRNQSWGRINSLPYLVLSIADVTGIDREVLLHNRRLEDCSYAERMSWASNRYTTRIEDMAYCLIGLFQVNMPLLYGEGQNAFRRLQDELLSKSTEQSLICWSEKNERLAVRYQHGQLLSLETHQSLLHKLQPNLSGSNIGPLHLLATCPEAFSDCAQVRVHKSFRTSAVSTGTEWNKLGLLAYVAMLPLGDTHGLYHVAVLRCIYQRAGTVLREVEKGNPVFIGVLCKLVITPWDIPQYEIWGCHYSQGKCRQTFLIEGLSTDLSGLSKLVMLRWTPKGEEHETQLKIPKSPYHPHQLPIFRFVSNLKLLDGYPKRVWNLKAGLLLLDANPPNSAAAVITMAPNTQFVMVVYPCIATTEIDDINEWLDFASMAAWPEIVEYLRERQTFTNSKPGSHGMQERVPIKQANHFYFLNEDVDRTSSALAGRSKGSGIGVSSQFARVVARVSVRYMIGTIDVHIRRPE